MTNRDMHFQIKQTATCAMLHGWHIEINRQLPYVSVEGPEEKDDYFFQEHEAEELLKEAEKAADKFDVHAYEYILWSAQGW